MSDKHDRSALTKLAEGWWDKTKRHLGYALPPWLGGDERPNFKNENKFLPLKDAPRSAEEQKQFLEKRRSKTRVGWSSKPGQGLELSDSIKKRRDEIVAEWQKTRKKSTAPKPAPPGVSPPVPGAAGPAAYAASEAARPRTSYEKFMRQSIPLKDQPQKSELVPPALKAAPSKTPKPSPINIKMRRGRGYNWLAKEINKQRAGSGQAITAADLRKRMGNQMLYANRGYSFDPANLGVKGSSITGGLNTKQLARAQRGMRSFIAARKKRRADIDAYAKANNLRSFAETRKSRPKYRRSRYDRRISNVRGATPIVQRLSRGEISPEEANKLLRQYGRRVAVGPAGAPGGAPRIVSTSVKPGGYNQETLQRIANEGRSRKPKPAIATR